MCAHGYQIATLLLNPFNNFLDRFTIGKFGFCRNAHCLKLDPDFFQVSSVLGDFGTHRIPAIGPSCPSVSYMKQYQAAVRSSYEVIRQR